MGMVVIVGSAAGVTLTAGLQAEARNPASKITLETAVKRCNIYKISFIRGNLIGKMISEFSSIEQSNIALAV
jgi:hypothetical protein